MSILSSFNTFAITQKRRADSSTASSPDHKRLKHEHDDAESYTHSEDNSTEHDTHYSEGDQQFYVNDSTSSEIGTVEEELRLTIDQLNEQIQAMVYEADRAEQERRDIDTLHRMKVKRYDDIIAVLDAQVQFQKDLIDHHATANERLNARVDRQQRKIEEYKLGMADVQWEIHHRIQDIRNSLGIAE
ncbi:hypothetical protein BDR03DRAFT_1017989 [Suillus americanus]|nr:hypothetical protein BDR03DRAFT_987963 [Suillus americanus]KAG2029767.1 hypothetical protein BDR03DRAFT_1017985 [Suillus americanus]KAG2029771.1 hypothetical protein BDR03DRAFT_1017989 [Suillus americanus]